MFFISMIINNNFVWERKPQNYSGFYQLDTGSHLLTDMLMMNRKEVLNVLTKHNIIIDYNNQIIKFK